MFKMIRKAFKAIKDFFTEPKVKTLEEYKRDALTEDEREEIGFDRAEILEYPSVKEKKGRYIQDRTGSWVLVTEIDVPFEGFEGWGSADVTYELSNLNMEVFELTFQMHTTEDFQDWSDTKVLEQFYIAESKRHRNEYSGLFIYKVNTIERINYV